MSKDENRDPALGRPPAYTAPPGSIGTLLVFLGAFVGAAVTTRYYYLRPWITGSALRKRENVVRGSDDSGIAERILTLRTGIGLAFFACMSLLLALMHSSSLALAVVPAVGALGVVLGALRRSSKGPNP